MLKIRHGKPNSKIDEKQPIVYAFILKLTALQKRCRNSVVFFGHG